MLRSVAKALTKVTYFARNGVYQSQTLPRLLGLRSIINLCMIGPKHSVFVTCADRGLAEVDRPRRAGRCQIFRTRNAEENFSTRAATNQWPQAAQLCSENAFSGAESFIVQLVTTWAIDQQS